MERGSSCTPANRASAMYEGGGGGERERKREKGIDSERRGRKRKTGKE